MDNMMVFCADQHSIDLPIQPRPAKTSARLKVSIPFNIKADFIKILGVLFGNEGAAVKSWEERLSKMKLKFELWSIRELISKEKTLLLHSKIMPVLQYHAQACPPQVNPCKAITRVVFYFIWDSKMDRVKWAVMFKVPLKGV